MKHGIDDIHAEKFLNRRLLNCILVSDTLNSGTTLCLRPMDATLDVTKFHVFSGVKKGDRRKGWTIERGAMVILVTTNVSDVAVMAWILATPGTVLARAWYSSSTKGAATSQTVNHSAFTSTIDSRCPIRTYLTKAGTIPSYGVARVNDGVT